IGTLLVSVAGVRNQTMVIASTLVVALVVVPLRNKLQTLVDRNLFRHKYDYPEALRAIAADTLSANDLGAFLTSAAEKTQHALQNRAVAMFVTRNEEFVAAAKVGLADSVIETMRMRRAPLLPLDRPLDPSRHALPEDAAAALKRLEAVLIVPDNTPGTPVNGFIVQAAVRGWASGSPRDLCERVRRVVVSSLTGGRFVTFFYATIDTASMRLRWCNAGHNAPVLAHTDGTIERLSDGGPAFSRLLRND